MNIAQINSLKFPGRTKKDAESLREAFMRIEEAGGFPEEHFKDNTQGNGLHKGNFVDCPDCRKH